MLDEVDWNTMASLMYSEELQMSPPQFEQTDQVPEREIPQTTAAVVEKLSVIFKAKSIDSAFDRFVLESTISRPDPHRQIPIVSAHSS